MSFFDIVNDDFNLSGANDEFVREVTHIPKGIIGNAVSITAVWEEGDPERGTEQGEEIVRRGELRVDATISLHHKDQWTINGEEWQTVRTTNQLEGGMKVSYLQRNDKATRKGKGVYR